MTSITQKQITVFSGIVIKGSEILMTLRNEEECPKAHLKWEFPGGKVNFGETPEEALKREFFEEAGVIVEVEDLLPQVQVSYWDYAWGKQQTLCFIFVCKYVDQVTQKEKDHHVKEIRWVDINDVKKLDTLPGANEFLELALKRVKL